MEWSNNLTVSRLFLSHDITLSNDANESYLIHIPSLRELSCNPFYHQFLQLLDGEQMEAWKKALKESSIAEILRRFMCDPRITNLKEFSPISNLLREHLSDILPQFKIEERNILVNGHPLTDDLLIELVYLLRLGIGQKVEKPPHFGPDEEAARLFYERSQAAKRKAEKIRAENSTDNKDSLMQMFILINYKFPVYTIEQMYNMTLAQLKYLQQMATAMISYEHNMHAYVAGNLKKAPNFFLK